MTKIDLAKGMKQIIGLGEFGSLEDDEGKKLNFKLDNKEAVEEGKFPVFKAKSKDGKKEYIAEFVGEIQVTENILPEKETKKVEEPKEEEDFTDKIKGAFSDSKKK
jgi:hypothetical protein